MTRLVVSRTLWPSSNKNGAAGGSSSPRTAASSPKIKQLRDGGCHPLTAQLMGCVFFVLGYSVAFWTMPYYYQHQMDPLSWRSVDDHPNIASAAFHHFLGAGGQHDHENPSMLQPDKRIEQLQRYYHELIETTLGKELELQPEMTWEEMKRLFECSFVFSVPLDDPRRQCHVVPQNADRFPLKEPDKDAF